MAEVFLSYSQADDFYPKEWVKKFHESLQTITLVVAGRRNFTIWRDVNDRVGNDLDQSIKDALDQSKFLLVLISPLYFEDASGWCKKERDYFVQNVIKDQDLARKRIIAALKYFDEKEDEIQLPNELKSQFRHKLYRLNERKEARPIDPTDPEWDNCLLSIAHTIKAELRNAEAKATAGKQRTVFLAASKELYDEQIRLKAELDTAGVRVKTLLPNLSNIDTWKNEFDEVMSTCQVSIHLLSQNYEIKTNINCSIEEKQWQWAIDHAKATPKRVLSWFPQGLANLDAKQQKFVDSIKNGTNLPRGHDFLEKTFEEFVASVKDYLKV